jgi:hypothetical protein
MSNALGISPSVMINRMAHQSGAPMAASLAKVAELRMDLMKAQAAEQARAALLNPAQEPAVLPLTSGAVVDRLI